MSRSSQPPLLPWHPPIALYAVKPPSSEIPPIEEIVCGPFTMMEWAASDHWHGGSVSFSTATATGPAHSGAVFFGKAPRKANPPAKPAKLTATHLRAFDGNTSVSPHMTAEVDAIIWWVARAGLWRLASFGGEIERVAWAIGVVGGRLYYRPLLPSEFDADLARAPPTPSAVSAYVTAASAACSADTT